MRMDRIVKIFGMVLFAIIFVAGFGEAVMQLWNWLLPSLFGWHVITFWQAVGILCLCRILFGGLRLSPRGMHMRHRMRERWERMSPEQREQFRQGMRRGCGPFGQQPTEAKS
jgi:hypothetical protein